MSVNSPIRVDKQYFLTIILNINIGGINGEGEV